MPPSELNVRAERSKVNGRKFVVRGEFGEFFYGRGSAEQQAVTVCNLLMFGGNTDTLPDVVFSGRVWKHPRRNSLDER